MAAPAPEDHAGSTSDAPPSPRSARTRFSKFVHRVHDKFGKASGPEPIVDQTRRTSVQKCSAALLTDPGLDAYFPSLIRPGPVCLHAHVTLPPTLLV
ncbi:hypothetical protein TRAPUB_8878 [Trametes pubescens]|uniref:Uncharacterized protein n=1 Tax=Trametes pubescens TaxID=154538 RepID=A0A1M2W4E1_TRAPU|nr:hypothetical protein TRAPUB_8878 [Trametes pubescens]